MGDYFVTLFQSSANTIGTAFGSILAFLPQLLIALIVFWIGAWVAGLIGELIARIIKAVKFDKIFESRGWSDAMKKAEIDGSPSDFVGAIVKWVFVIIFLVIVADILKLPGFTEMLNKLVAYLPNVLIAALIFVATVIISDMLEKVVVVSIGGMKVGYATAIGTFVRWVIWVFAIFAILMQLGIAEQLVFALFQSILQFFILALGLAFGLGGKDVAGELLKELKDKIKK